MSFAPQFQAPQGIFDTGIGAGHQPLHANIFRPPPSPTGSGSSYNLAKSTGSLFSDISMGTTPQYMGTAKRKRPTRESTPQDWNMNMDGAHEAHDERAKEFRYTLAGQISTNPAAAPTETVNGILDDSVYSDVDYRRALGPKTDMAESPPLGTSPPTGPTTAPAAPPLIPWSLFSLQTLGDMVGKVWEFCKTGAFKGFRAGGGQAYRSDGTTVTETPSKEDLAEHESPLPQQPEDDSPAIHMPGYFPQLPTESPSSPQYYGELGSSEPTPQPAVKRRQVSANNDELRNWVVVDDEEPSDPQPQPQPRRFATEVKAAAARPSGLIRPRTGYYSQVGVSSHRRISAPSPRFAGSAATLTRGMTRPSLRISQHTTTTSSLAGSPPSAREPASFASPRASAAGLRSTPSRIPVAVGSSPTHPPQQQQSYNPNPFALPTPTSAAAAAAAGRTSPSAAPLKSSSLASRPSSRQSLSRPASRQSLSGSVSGSGRPGRSPTSRHSLGGGISLSPTPSNIGKSLRPISPTKLGHKRGHSSTSRSRLSLHAAPPSAALGLPRPEEVIEASPRLDAEARKLAQRRLEEEMDAEEKVDVLNAKLLSMIRQGREALGTKVEVEELEMMDGDGFEDEGEDHGGFAGNGFGNGAGGYHGNGGWEDDDGYDEI